LIDGRTDGQKTYCRMTALCVALRGNNILVNAWKP